MADKHVLPAPAATVGDAMITGVKVHDVRTTVAQLRTLFVDEHVHSAVILDSGELLAVVDRGDLDANDATPAVELGRLGSRVVAPDLDLEAARESLLASGRRRLAVVGLDGRFLGLLCLKRSRLGFCSDRDVRARADEAAQMSTLPASA